MDAKERIIKTLNHEEPDRVPSYEGGIDNLAICEYYGKKYYLQGIERIHSIFYSLSFGNLKLMNKLMGRLAEGRLSAKKLVGNWGDLYRKIGIDLCHIVLFGFPIQFDKKGIVSEFGHRFDYKKNPSDGITMPYYMGGVLKDFADYESFPLPDPDRPVREKTFKAAKKLENKHKGKIHLAPAISGLMEVTWEGFGIEDFSILLAHRKEAKKVFDDRGNFALEMVKRIIEWGEDGVLFVLDDMGYKKGLFMNPKLYREYIFPWYERICKTAHKGGLKLLLHSCGDVNLLFEDIINSSVDAINPIEPTTANPEFDIFKLHEKYGDKITLIGNISPQDLADKDPQYIQNSVKKLIKYIAPGGGYILSSGHSINPSVKLENFLAMMDALKKYGTYPIS